MLETKQCPLCGEYNGHRFSCPTLDRVLRPEKVVEASYVDHDKLPKLEDHSMSKQSVYDIYLEMVVTGVVDDRIEYDHEDIKQMYDTTDEQTEELYKLLHDEDHDVEQIVNLCVEKRYGRTTGEAIKIIEQYADPVTSEFFVEMIHNGSDGWDPSSMPTLVSLVHDLATWHANYQANKS